MTLALPLQGSQSSYFYYPGSLSSSPTLLPLTGKQKQSSWVKSHVRASLLADHTSKRGAGVVARQPRGLEGPNLVIETDASRMGWGAYCMGTSSTRGGGEWSQAESSLHINCLELLAGAFAVKTFTKGKAKMTVRLVTAHYINKMGVPNHQSLLDLHSTFGIGAHNTGSLSRPNIYQELKNSCGQSKVMLDCHD